MMPNRLLNNKLLIILSTFSISILAGFLPFDRFLSLQRTLSFMPFFFLGYYMKDKNIFLPQRYRPISIIFLITTILIPMFFSQYLGSLMQADPYHNYDGAFYRMIVFVLAIMMSIAFLNICPNMHWISKQGELTMQYYIYHALLLPIIMILSDKINMSITFYHAIIYTLIILLVLGLASRLPYFRNLTNPSTFWNK